MKNLSPENQLLLCCAGTDMDKRATDRAGDILKYPLNWDYLLKTASGHCAASLLYNNLRRMEIKGMVPEGAMKRLERIYHTTAYHNVRLFQEAGKILNALNSAGIESMILKGPALTEIVYKNPALRPIGDIDLLVREKDFKKIKYVMGSNGYTSSIASLELSGIDAVKYAQYFEQIRFSGSKFSIETHFRLINMGVPKPDEVGVWQRSISLNLAGSKALIPSCEDFLLHLCVHAAQHNFSRLLILCDIAGWIREYSHILNRRLLVDLVDEMKARTIIFYSLFFTRELLGVSVPTDIMEGLRPKPVKTKLFEIIWNKEDILKLKKKKRATALEAPFCYLFGMGRIRDKILYLLMILYNSIKWSYLDRYSDSGPKITLLRLMKRIFIEG